MRTRTAEEIVARLHALRRRLRPHQWAFLSGQLEWLGFVQRTFGAATNRYAQYLNHQLGQCGQLFVKPTLPGLTDKGLPGEEYSKTLAAYVGLNYSKHGLAPAEAPYPWSSLTAPKYHIIEPDIELHYGSEEAYRAYHVWYLRKYGAQLLAFDEAHFFAALRPRVYIEAYGTWLEVQREEGHQR